MYKINEAEFISHCDDNTCDLGSFLYKCPSCNNATIDYDVWWNQDDLYKNETINFNCEKCKTDLNVNHIDYKFVVSENKTYNLTLEQIYQIVNGFDQQIPIEAIIEQLNITFPDSSNL